MSFWKWCEQVKMSSWKADDPNSDGQKNAAPNSGTKLALPALSKKTVALMKPGR